MRRGHLFLLTTLVQISYAVLGQNTALGCNALPPGDRFNLFADYMKTSIFGQPLIPGSQNITVDLQGWPTQDFSLLFYNEPGGFYYPAADLSGIHTLTALGCATLSIPTGVGGLTILNQTCPGGDLLAFVEVSSDGDAVRGRLALAFTATTRGSGKGAGLTNVSLLLPGYPAGTDPDTLHEPALANMRGRCTVTRFLGWNFYGHTQWDGVTPPTPCDWSLRPRLGAPSYFLGGWGTYGAGVPYEIIAAVVNAIDSDVWLNVPSTTNETARDEYVTNLITQMDSLLAPGKKMYLEHANECMFGNNQCYPDAVALANSSVLERGDPYRLNYGLSSPPNATAHLISFWNPRMYAWTALHYAALSAGVVGAARVGRADTPGVRVVPVVGANGGYGSDGVSKLEWLHDAWGPPAAAGLATMNIGAYWGAARNVTTNPAVTTEEVLDSLLANIAGDAPTNPTAYTSGNALAQYATASAYHGIALHAYEGGPDTSGGVGTAGQMALAKACSDPRMADAVAGIVGVWQAWTGGTFNYFTLGAQPLQQPWGSYSNLWDLKVPDTPKSKGIDRVVGSPPAPLGAGWPAPLLNHSASLYVGYYTKDGLPPSNPVVSYLPLNASLSYLVRFPPSPCSLGINVSVSWGSRSKGGGDPLEVSVGSFLPPVTITSPPMAGTKLAFTDTSALFPSLPAAALSNGLVAVRLHVPATGVQYELLAISVACR